MIRGMISRLLPLLFAAAVFAEAPRPRPGFEGVGRPIHIRFGFR